MSASGAPFEADAVRERAAARVVLLDEHDRVLLIEGHDPGRPERGWYWFTVGGGLDEGETPEVCAVREVREETGLELEVAALGPVAREDRIEFPFEGTLLRQRQWFYVVRVASFDPDTSGWQPLEVRVQRSMRWWSLDDLRSTEATIFPEDLADLVAEHR